jgi:molybdate transport system substrate-binding protein
LGILDQVSIKFATVVIITQSENLQMNIKLFGKLVAGIITVFMLIITPQLIAAEHNSSLLISAAASLQDVLTELSPAFEKTHPHISVKYNFASSGSLQRQIEQGAPVDLFIAAAAKPIDDLESQGLLFSSRLNLLTNRLVLIKSRSSSATNSITSVRSLTSNDVKRIAIGEPRSVPVGKYSEEVFKNLGILAQIRSKFVLGNSVRNVLAAVESGNADAGIVYLTDAKISKRLNIIEIIPTNLHSPIVYPMAILKNSKNLEATQKFVKFLTMRSLKPVFVKYGFGTF